MKILIFIFHLIIYSSSQSVKYFITDSFTCGTFCDGSILNPFDNLWIALSTISTSTDVELLVLKPNSLPGHFILFEERSDSVTNYSLKPSLSLQTNLVIRPLSCENDPESSDPTLSGRCLQTGEKVVFYPKSESLRIEVTKSLILQDIEFNDSENILNKNSAISSNLEVCLYSRVLCCAEGAEVSTLYSDVICQPSFGAYYPSGLNNSFLILNSTADSRLLLSGVQFSNYAYVLKKSLISIVDCINVTMKNVVFNRTYFSNGIINHFTGTQKNNRTSISIEDTTIISHNPFSVNQTGTRVVLYYSSFTKSSDLNLLNLTFGWSNLTENQYFIYSPGGLKINVKSSLFNNLTIQSQSALQTGLFFTNMSNLTLTDCDFSGLNVYGNAKVISLDGGFLQMNTIRIISTNFANFESISCNSTYFASLSNQNTSISNITFTNSTWTALTTNYYSMGIFSIISGEFHLSNFHIRFCSFSDQYLPVSIIGTQTTITDVYISFSTLASPTQISNFFWLQNAPYFAYLNNFNLLNCTFTGLFNFFNLLGSYNLSGMKILGNSLTSTTSANIIRESKEFFDIVGFTSNLEASFNSLSRITFVYHMCGTCTYDNIHFICNTYTTTNQDFWNPLPQLLVVSNLLISSNTKLAASFVYRSSKNSTLSLTNAKIISNSLSKTILFSISDSSVAFLTNLEFYDNLYTEHSTTLDQFFIYLEQRTNLSLSNLFAARNTFLSGGGMLYSDTSINGVMKNISFNITEITSTTNGIYMMYIGGFSNFSLSDCSLMDTSISSTSPYKSVFLFYASWSNVELKNYKIDGVKVTNAGNLIYMTLGTANLYNISVLNLVAQVVSAGYISVRFKNMKVYSENFVFYNHTVKSTTPQNLNLMRVDQSKSLNLFKGLSFVNIYTDFLFIFSLQTLENFEIHDFLMKDLKLNGTFFAMNIVFSKGSFTNATLDSNLYKNQFIVFDRNTEINFNRLTTKNNVIGNLQQFYVTGGSSMKIKDLKIENNTINKGTRLLFLDIKSSLSLDGAIIQNNNLTGANILVSIHADIKQSRVNVLNNVIDGSSNLFYSSSSNLELSDITVINMTRIALPKQTLNIAQMFLFTFELSKITFQNLFISNCSSLLYFSSSNAALKNVSLDNIYPDNNTYILISSLHSSLNIETITIGNLRNTLNMTESAFFSFFLSQISIIGLHMKDIYENQRPFFRMTTSDLILYDSNLQNLTSNGFSLINSYQGDSIKLHNITAINCSSFFNGDSVGDVIVSNSFFLLSSSIETYFQAQEANSLTILETIFMGNEANLTKINGPLISLDEIGSLANFNGCSFSNFNSTVGVFKIKSQSYTSNFSFTRSSFTNLWSYQDGSAALTAQDIVSSNILIQDNIFINNNALKIDEIGGKGGAIFISSANFSEDLKPSYQILQNAFINCSASSYGGAIYIEGIPPILISNKFSQNSANSIPNDVGSQPVGLKYLTTTSSSSRLLQVYTPNLSPAPPIIDNLAKNVPAGSGTYIAVVDMFGQVVHSDSTSILQLVITSGSQTTSTVISASNGLYNLESLTINSPVGQTPNISFISNAIKLYKNLASVGANVSQSVTSSISYRSCTAGELRLADESCEVCQYGYTHFSLQENYVGVCKPCDQAKMICRGGDDVGPAPGYWRMNGTADIFVRCPEQENCLGGLNGDILEKTSLCNEGYTGNLCAQCDDGLGRIRENASCTDYSSQSGVYFLIFFSLFVCLLGLGLMVRTAVKKKDEKTVKKITEDHKFAMIRNVVNHFQILTMIFNLPLTWPNEIFVFNNIQKSFIISDGDIFSLTYFDFEVNSYLSRPYLRLLLINLLPFVLIAICFFILKLLKCLKLVEKNIKNNLALTTMIAFYFSSVILYEDIRHLTCKNLYRQDDPEYYLASEPNYLCYSKYHSAMTVFIVLPSITIWAGLIPIIILKFIRKSKKTDSHTQNTIITDGLRENLRFWEFAIFAKKILIMVVNMLMIQANLNQQIYLILYIIIAFFIVEDKLNPYSSNDLVEVGRFSFLALFMSSLSGIFFELINQKFKGGVQLYSALAIFSNLLYLVKWFATLIESNAPNKKSKGGKFIIKVRSIFSSFCKKLKKTDSIPKSEAETPAVENNDANNIDHTMPIPLSEIISQIDDDLSDVIYGQNLDKGRNGMLFTERLDESIEFRRSELKRSVRAKDV